MNLDRLCKGQPSPINPGVHLNVPRNHYDQIPALSRTAIHKWIELGEIPSKYDYWLRERWNEKPTEALLLGSALDCRMLDGDFEAHFAVSQPVDRRTTAGKAQWAAFQAANAGKRILTADQAHTVGMMAASLRAAETVSGVFENCRKAVIVETAGGMPMKMEVDLWNPNSLHMMDLKTARDVSPHWWSEAFIDFGYDFQASFYLLLANAAGFEKRIFDFACVENEPPWTAKVYSFTPHEDEEHWAIFDANRIRITRAAKEIARRLETNNFKDSQDWERVKIPGWAVRNAELEVLAAALP